MSETGELITDKYLSLCADFSAQGVSMSALANECSIRKSSLYSHFPSKEEMLSSALAKARDTLLALAGGIPMESSDPSDALFSVAYHLYLGLGEDKNRNSFILLNSEKCRLKDAYAYFSQFTKMCKARVQVLLDILYSKNFIAGFDPESLSSLFLTGLFALFDDFIARGKKDEKWDEFAWEVSRFCENFLLIIKKA